jgi:4-methylaminobutanoate oxidase (formaldehyde-forming)
LLSQKQGGVKRRLTVFVLEDPEPVLWGSEPIFRDGKAVGYTTSGSYGHSVGGAIAMGYVNNATGATPQFIQSGRYEINVSGQRYPAKAFLRAPYDPERKKILA